MERLQLLLALLFGDALVQSHDHIRHSIGLVHRQRQPNAIVAEPAEPRRHYTDHGMRLIVQPQGLADGIRIAIEQPLPRQIAEHHYWFRLTARTNVYCRDCAAENWLDAQELKCVTRQQYSLEVFRCAIASEEHVIATVRHDVGESR